MRADRIVSPPRLADVEAPASVKHAESIAMKAEQDLRRIAADFESVFSKMLLTSMRKTIPRSPLFHAGRGGEIFSELLDNRYSEVVSRKGGGLGFASMIVKKYAAHVEAQDRQNGGKLDMRRDSAAEFARETEGHE
jgi:Rod binding domain-containing protein